MEQFEQLLTCCVCLDRYRIPKLLPCQHSFCMEPCMEGLVDYVRRQVKCPECRAEHRIPYNGVQAFPTNVTLQRFLELHIEITGELPDPTSGQIMERCGVCSEKAYLQPCAHCEKKICDDCKSAHMDILRREITRFNSQIRRSLHRLQDSLAMIEKNMVSLQTNCVSTSDEIDEIYRRITKAIKDRSDHLKSEIDRYLTTELRNLNNLKENLDTEINNISSNCDMVDKYMNDTVEWDDCELMDTKEIFLKTVEFLRHFEYENSDYTRRVRFLVSIDPNQLVMNLSTFGDLNITPHAAVGSASSSHLAPPSSLQPGLMRSKSDHRLATQFRQQEERIGYNDEPVLGGRRFGERPVRINNDRYGDSSSSRYSRGGGGDYDYDNDYDNDQSTRSGKSRFRSRFVRSHQNDDSDNEQQQLQRNQEEKKLKDKVRDGEDASRGQLSGIIRLSDCARVIQRLADIGKEKKEKKVDTAAQAAVQAAIQAQKASMQRPKQQPQRQVSEDDEISRIKRQNKNAPSSSTAATAALSTNAESTDRPATDRVSALKRNSVAPGASTDESENSSHNASPVRRTPPSIEVSVIETNEEGNNPSSSINSNKKVNVKHEREKEGEEVKVGYDEDDESEEGTVDENERQHNVATNSIETSNNIQINQQLSNEHTISNDSDTDEEESEAETETETDTEEETETEYETDNIEDEEEERLAEVGCSNVQSIETSSPKIIEINNNLSIKDANNINASSSRIPQQEALSTESAIAEDVDNETDEEESGEGEETNEEETDED